MPKARGWVRRKHAKSPTAPTWRRTATCGQVDTPGGTAGAPNYGGEVLYAGLLPRVPVAPLGRGLHPCGPLVRGDQAPRLFGILLASGPAPVTAATCGWLAPHPRHRPSAQSAQCWLTRKQTGRSHRWSRRAMRAAAEDADGKTSGEGRRAQGGVARVRSHARPRDAIPQLIARREQAQSSNVGSNVGSWTPSSRASTPCSGSRARCDRTSGR